VQSRPELYCISSGTTVQDTTCACMTEQGTKYPMRLDFCALMARDGPDYSRYREARQSGQTGAQASSGGGGGAGGGGGGGGGGGPPPSNGTPPNTVPLAPLAPGAVIRVTERPMATFPESVQNRHIGA
jgi:hypothetical protein